MDKNFYYNGTAVELRECTVEINLLGKNKIEKYLTDYRSNDVNRYPKPKHTAKKLEKVSEKQKYIEIIKEKLDAVCDAESEDDDDEPKKSKTNNVSNATDSNTEVKKATEALTEAIIKKKSDATSDIQPPIPLLKVSQNKPKLTFSQVTRKINIPTKNPVPIIEAPTMIKGRQSTSGEAKASKRKRSIVEGKDVDPSPSDLKQDFLRVRAEKAEKLRYVAEKEKQQNKETATKKDRVVSIPKVKVTKRNRGVFLAELPITSCAPPQKKPSNGPKVSCSHPEPSAHASVAEAALPVPLSLNLSIWISKFKQNHLKPFFR